jgi:hypothetical protein
MVSSLQNLPFLNLERQTSTMRKSKMLKYDGDLISLLLTIGFFGAGIIGIVLCVFFPKSIGYDSFMPEEEGDDDGVS